MFSPAVEPFRTKPYSRLQSTRGVCTLFAIRRWCATPRACPGWITHCTIVTPELVKRIKVVGAVPNLFATYPFYNADKFSFYSPAMMDRAMAYRWLLDAGVPATAGSDFPPARSRR